MPGAKQYLEPRPRALARLKHVVVLMLENRSFDNLLGWLYAGTDPPRGQQFDGLRPDMWNPLSNIDPNGARFVERVRARRNGDAAGRGRRSSRPAPPDFRLPNPDPGEGYRNTNQQLFGHYEAPELYPPEPANCGFVENYANAMLYGTYAFGDIPADPREIMTAYTPEQVPVLSTLAREFAVSDRWYCSVPSQTLPNRDFVHAATSAGLVDNHPQPDCDAPTIFNRFQDAIDGGRGELDWKVYSGESKGKPFSLTRLIMTRLHDAKLDAHFVGIDRFAADAAAGRLPSYSFLEPQFTGPGQNDQHPNSDVRAGDALIARVYEAVRDSPAWHETLLVINYDEHGGCFDHSPPPKATPPDGEGKPGQHGFRFNRFGVRVPAVLVSPYIERGTVARAAGPTPFDHTSIIATLRGAFDLGAPLTARDAAAPDLGCVMTRSRPRADRPEVHPLAWTPGAAGDINGLHRAAEAVLAKLDRADRPPEQDLIEFIHARYARYFDRLTRAARSG